MSGAGGMGPETRQTRRRHPPGKKSNRQPGVIASKTRQPATAADRRGKMEKNSFSAGH